MRRALTHARDWSCLVAAIALILYITVVPQRPQGDRPGSGATMTASLEPIVAIEPGERVAVAAGTALPETTR